MDAKYGIELGQKAALLPGAEQPTDRHNHDAKHREDEWGKKSVADQGSSSSARSPPRYSRKSR